MTTMMEALHTEGVVLRMEVESSSGDINIVYPIAMSAWLNASNAGLKSDDVRSIRSIAILPSGEEVGIGSWTKVDATCQWKDGNPNFRPIDVSMSQEMLDLILENEK